MRNIILTLMAWMAMAVSAQENLSGRVYHHPNILADEINQTIKEAKADVNKMRADAIAKAEAKKERKLTDSELKEVDKRVEEGLKMLEAMRTGMKTAVTVTFKDEKNVVMKTDMKIEDSVLKAAGVSWAKRKMIKLATNIMPAQKGTYEVKGNQVFVYDGEETDTLRLSTDGKYLYGKLELDDNKKFKLTRIQ